jgi:integrase/recombinase XerC
MCSTDAPNSFRGLPEVCLGFLASLEVEKGYSLATVRAYATDLEQFAAHLVRRGKSLEAFQAITREDATGFLAELHRLRQKKSSMARKLSTLRSFFRYLLRNRLVDANPLSGLRNPRQETRQPRALNVDQACAIWTRQRARPKGFAILPWLNCYTVRGCASARPFRLLWRMFVRTGGLCGCAARVARNGWPP